jgi:hypothetical protein
MEGANAGGRQAGNAVLEMEPFKQFDRELWRQGRPHAFDDQGGG